MPYDPFGPTNSSYNPVVWGQQYGPNSITVSPPASGFDPFQYYGSPADDPFGPYRWNSNVQTQMPRLPNPLNPTGPPPGTANPGRRWDLSSALQSAIDSIKGGQARWNTLFPKLMNKNAGIFGDYEGPLGSAQIQQLLGIAMEGGQQQFLNKLLRRMAGGDDGGGDVGGGDGGGGGFHWQGRGADAYRLQELIDRLMDSPGFAPDVLDAMRNQARNQAKLTERDQIFRRGDEFAARGLFGSGLSRQAIQGIEQATGNALSSSMTNIDIANAQAQNQNWRAAIGAISAAIQRELGLGQLDLGQQGLGLNWTQLGLDQAFREWLQNMWLAQNSI